MLNTVQLVFVFYPPVPMTSQVFDVVAFAVILALQQVINEQDALYNEKLPALAELSINPGKRRVTMRKGKAPEKGKASEMARRGGRSEGQSPQRRLQGDSLSAAAELDRRRQSDELPRQDGMSVSSEGGRGGGGLVRFDGHEGPSDAM